MLSAAVETWPSRRHFATVCQFTVAVLLLQSVVVEGKPRQTLRFRSRRSRNPWSVQAREWGRSMSVAEAEQRCRGTIGGRWCFDYHLQTPIPAKAPPRGNRTCLNDCNGAGICDHSLGTCFCTAGWTGDYCQIRQKRPCTNRWRGAGGEATSSTASTDKGWTASRCLGVCDEDIAACFCNGTRGRIPAPPHLPPLWKNPVQLGRPMTLHCHPKLDDLGNPVSFGLVENEKLFGPEGWCEAAQPAFHCPCVMDGIDGPTCEMRKEPFCVNQCSGKGDCLNGFCRCFRGYYGHDCAHRVQGSPELSGLEMQRPWLHRVMVPPVAAEDPPVLTKRLRPLIYVYDLPPDYNARLLQYRITQESCVHRLFNSTNGTVFTAEAYRLETVLHELLLQSPHRTLDPGEADYFYVPVYLSCYAHPVYGWADHPWYYNPNPYRVHAMAIMALEAKRWIENHRPWWKRRGGADHIWLFTHDEGPCWVPSEIWNTSIILSHWGRKDVDHTSNTGYDGDNYSADTVDFWGKISWSSMVGRHPCYQPQLNKDLIVPAYKPPSAMLHSPYLPGAVVRERDILFFFMGDFRQGLVEQWRYSRYIRQSLRAVAKEQNWWEKYRIFIGSRAEKPVDKSYGELLASSVFCLVAPGDGFSPRGEDAILHGCIPVVIMDDVDPVFASLLDWPTFSVRIAEADVNKTADILRAISEDQIRSMQEQLAKVWRRFVWAHLPAAHTSGQPVPPPDDDEDPDEQMEEEFDGPIESIRNDPGSPETTDPAGAVSENVSENESGATNRLLPQEEVSSAASEDISSSEDPGSTPSSTDDSGRASEDPTGISQTDPVNPAAAAAAASDGAGAASDGGGTASDGAGTATMGESLPNNDPAVAETDPAVAGSTTPINRHLLEFSGSAPRESLRPERELSLEEKQEGLMNPLSNLIGEDEAGRREALVRGAGESTMPSRESEVRAGSLLVGRVPWETGLPWVPGADNTKKPSGHSIYESGSRRDLAAVSMEGQEQTHWDQRSRVEGRGDVELGNRLGHPGDLLEGLSPKRSIAAKGWGGGREGVLQGTTALQGALERNPSSGTGGSSEVLQERRGEVEGLTDASFRSGLKLLEKRSWGLGLNRRIPVRRSDKGHPRKQRKGRLGSAGQLNPADEQGDDGDAQERGWSGAERVDSGGDASYWAPYYSDTSDDALDTLMAWLYWKLEQKSSSAAV